ncbi:MAG: beta-ketoacyl reductase [Chitinophagales bacterium]|nr:beta-ketoacyl reductase [Chitinophagales bacterium]
MAELSENTLPKSIVIVKDNHGLAERLEEKLREKGIGVEIISTTEMPTSIPDTVVHLASTNERASLYDAVFSIQDLIKTFQERGKSSRLFAVTKNAQIVHQNDQENHIPGAVLWGVMRTLQNEFPELKPVTIDTDENTNADKIIQLLAQSDSYKEMAVRGEEVFVPVLKPITAHNEETHQLDTDGTYLITGGTSGLGLYFAEWLTTQGVKSLALVSRSGMKAETQAVVDRLKVNEVNIEVYAVDISNANALNTLVQDIESKQSEIKSVVHAAGVLDDGAFLNLTTEQFGKVLTPKINGAWNLHTYFKDRNLSNFILFSSAATVLGSAAQANYNAGNMVLDQLAQLRNAQDLPALSINFGNIGEIGLAAADIKRGERLKEQGMNTMSPDELSIYFKQVLDLQLTQCVLLDIDFKTWSESNEGIKDNHFYQYVLQVSEEKLESKTDNLPYTNKAGAVRYYKNAIKGMISKITKIPSSKIKGDATFKSIGIDSLMAVQLKNALQKESGLDLMVASIWTYPTVDKYTDFIVQELKIEDKTSSAVRIEDEVRNWTYTNKNAAVKDFKNILKEHISAITKIPSFKIKEDATFKSMGIDSLMAVQLKNKFQSEFGINIAVSSIWTYSTVEKYAQFIADELKINDLGNIHAESNSTQPANTAIQPELPFDTIEKQVDELSLDDLLDALDED